MDEDVVGGCGGDGCSAADKDCDGVCFGPAHEDPCGACDATADNDCPCSAAVRDIDQEQTDDFTLIEPWQSFTPTRSGNLAAIDIRPNAYDPDGVGISGQLRFYTGEGTSGTLLHSQSYSIASVSSAPWQRFNLTQSLSLTEGQQYTWELTGANGIMCGDNDPYAGGRASPTWGSYDMAFRTWVGSCR